MSTLKEFVEKSAKKVKEIFKATEVWLPIYHFTDVEGRQFILPAPMAGKEASVAIARAILDECNAVRVLCIGEAWALYANVSERERLDREGLESQPGKEEVIFFLAEDASEGIVTACMKVNRDGERASLGPLVFDPAWTRFDGRMVGLLPNRGKRS